MRFLLHIREPSALFECSVCEKYYLRSIDQLRVGERYPCIHCHAPRIFTSEDHLELVIGAAQQQNGSVLCPIGT